MLEYNLSAIASEDLELEEGEILDGEDPPLNDDDTNDDERKVTFFDILKRSFDKRNKSQNCSLSLDETFGIITTDDDDDGNYDSALGSSTTSPSDSNGKIKPLKDRGNLRRELKDLENLRRELNASFSAFDEKLALRDDSVLCIGEKSAESSGCYTPESTSSRAPFSDRQRVASGTSTLSSNIGGIPVSKLDEKIKPILRSKLLSRALGELNRQTSSAPSGFPIAPPPSSSTPKKPPKIERLYRSRPANSRPTLVDLSSPVAAYDRSRPATRRPTLVDLSSPVAASPRTIGSNNPRLRKRAKSPDENDDDFPRSKRSRDEKRVETVDLTQERPSIRGRQRVASLSNAPRRPPTSPGRDHARSSTTVTKDQEVELNDLMDVTKRIDGKCDQVILIDLDNWVNFFGRLNTHLPKGAFVWGFWGHQTNWYRPRGNAFFDELVETGRFEETRAGVTKDAADFALVYMIGRLDLILKDKNIGFTIISGDRGFGQVKMSMETCKRRVQIINPHRDGYGNGGMDTVLRRHCRRSLSCEPKLKSAVVSCF